MRKPFGPWKDRIKRARRVGHFTKLDREKAEDWLSCAVSEHVPEIRSSLMHSWAVLDALGERGVRLQELGYSFSSAVQTNDIKQANRIYLEIQKT